MTPQGAQAAAPALRPLAPLYADRMPGGRFWFYKLKTATCEINMYSIHVLKIDGTHLRNQTLIIYMYHKLKEPTCETSIYRYI